MSDQLSDTDRAFLRQAIEISRHALEDEGKTPFGAVVVVNNEVVGTGTSSVVGLHDPTAHAEVMALRACLRRSNVDRRGGVRAAVAAARVVRCRLLDVATRPI